VLTYDEDAEWLAGSTTSSCRESLVTWLELANTMRRTPCVDAVGAANIGLHNRVERL